MMATRAALFFVYGVVTSTSALLDNYAPVCDDIAELIRSDAAYDDGTFGPFFVRLAWHQAGTFDPVHGVGGSTNASMRYSPEAAYEANKGLARARIMLEPIKQKYGAGLSYADLWSLAGVLGIQETGGPTISWRGGRVDQPAGPSHVPEGNLPDAAATKGDAIRRVFHRMGFRTDAEIVALIGAHAIGRGHDDRSGYSGAWTRAPARFGNGFFSE